jgi:hypothetical protein
MPINTLKASAPGVVGKDVQHISLITWVGNGAIGDTLLIEDNEGHVVWEGQAPVASYNMSLSYGRPVAINGLNVVTLTSGTVVFTYV